MGSNGDVYGNGSVYYSYSLADYWWLRSPVTVRDDGACLVFPDGNVNDYVSYGGYVDDSYGRILPTLRTPFTLTTRVGWVHLVSSASATTTMCTIPTAKLITGGFALRAPMSLATRVGYIPLAMSATATMWAIPSAGLSVHRQRSRHPCVSSVVGW